MSLKYLLVISKDYWGTQKSESIAKEFSKTLSNLIGIPKNNIMHLIGDEVTINKVKDTIYRFVIESLLDNPNEPRLFIYINGHGNQTVDSNGDEMRSNIDINETYIDNLDELYQLPDGNLLDDDLTSIIDQAILHSNVVNRPCVCLISDHCSSGSMIDKTQRFFDWISIGSSLDNQDSFVNGDGNIMTYCLINVLKSNNNVLQRLTALDFYNLLNIEMKNSFIGELQTVTFHISSSDMINYKLFF